MGRPKKEKKGEFEDLPEEFKAKVQASDEAAIRSIIADKAMYGSEVAKAKKEDQQLKEAQEAAKSAGAFYKEAAKDIKLSIGFCKQVLQGRGLAVPEIK